MSRFGVNSEYGRLSAVLLHQPGAEIANHPDPAAIQQLRPLDAGLLATEGAAVRETFASRGVTVTLLDPAPLSADRSYRYNLMFCRDLFFMTPKGAILASMANETRRGEVAYAARALERLGVPLLQTVNEGRFEGADALWITPRLVAIGVGNRTDRAAFARIRAVLAAQGVDCVALPSTQQATQHLLGSLQLVDRDLALVRSGIAAPEVTAFLAEQGYRVVAIPENSEVTGRQAMNIVTLAPRQIIMTAGCPETRQLYVAAGLNVVAEVAISQLISAAGGLACATGILSREDSFDDTRTEML